MTIYASMALSPRETSAEVAKIVLADAGDFMSPAAAAQLVGVSASTIWRWINSGRLLAYRVGPRSIRVRRDDLKAVIQPARVGPSTPEHRAPAQHDAASPDPAELARRKAIAARILALRAEATIAPRTTADLIRQVRADGQRSRGAR